MKFRKHQSGMKNKSGKPYTSGYDARIPAEMLKAAGLLEEDGSLKEYEVVIMHRHDNNEAMIVLRKKEAEA